MYSVEKILALSPFATSLVRKPGRLSFVEKKKVAPD
jgi:hypothetical protein